jgi:hypothetical protein
MNIALFVEFGRWPNLFSGLCVGAAGVVSVYTYRRERRRIARRMLERLTEHYDDKEGYPG